MENEADKSFFYLPKMLRPTEYAWLQRTFPYFQADDNAWTDAVKKAAELRDKNKLKYLNKTEQFPEWEFAGPTNIGGRISDIEFDPQNPNILYAGAATGGIFKSTDMGENWFPVFDDQPILPIGDIGINPSDPRIIYAGTGEPNGGHNNFNGGGVFRSTDAGDTWELTGLENTSAIGRIVIDPINTNNIYVAAVGSYFGPNPERGIFKSTNGGDSWEKILFVSDSTGAIDIVVNPDNPDLILAAMWERVRRPNDVHLYGPSGGIFKSTNGGAEWKKLGPETGLPDTDIDFVSIGRIGLALCTEFPDIVYALYNDGSKYTGLYKTTNSGDNWLEIDLNKDISKGASTFSWYFGQVRVNPVDPEIVYALDVSFMKSTNGGETFPLRYGYSGISELHVDHHALAFHPQNPDFLVNGNDGGINISTDGGETWSDPAMLPVTQFYEIEIDPNNPAILYGGTQDNGTNRTPDGGKDNWEVVYGGDGFYVLVNPSDSDIIFAEAQFGVLGKSVNGGLSFNPALNGINQKDPVNWSAPLEIDPNNHNVLYFGTNKIYRTNDGLSKQKERVDWEAISDDLTDGGPDTRLGTITSIAVAPSNSRVIYTGTDDGNVWVSPDSGVTWKNISANLPYRWVTRVKVDPFDENKVYVTFSGLKWKDPQPHIFKSGDMGFHWENISSNLPDSPVNAFAVDYYNTDILYAGSDVGAFVSYNGGGFWESLGDKMPMVSVYDLKIHARENFLVAGTHGRSMYKLDLTVVNEADDPEDNFLPSEFVLYQNYPNPFNPTTTIKYEIPNIPVGTGHDLSLRGIQVQLIIYDILGHEIEILVNEYQNPGVHEVNFNAADYASGVYLLRLESGLISKTKKMMLLK